MLRAITLGRRRSALIFMRHVPQDGRNPGRCCAARLAQAHASQLDQFL